jgi:hypothetical protein
MVGWDGLGGVSIGLDLKREDGTTGLTLRFQYINIQIPRTRNKMIVDGWVPPRWDVHCSR